MSRFRCKPKYSGLTGHVAYHHPSVRIKIGPSHRPHRCRRALVKVKRCTTIILDKIQCGCRARGSAALAVTLPFFASALVRLLTNCVCVGTSNGSRQTLCTHDVYG
jgi:hypothetical protein